jgi:hypothetical protein
VRRESRRQRREQAAVELAGQNSAARSERTQAEPLLDEAMDALPEADRNAVLLRFFEGKDLKTVGGALGVSEEAARKRVARAVERLRQFFSKRGVEVSSAGVVALLCAKAVEAAPAGPLSETLAAKLALLRQKLEQTPALNVPELKFADEKDWLQAAARVQTDSDEDARKGLSLLRTLAMSKVAPSLSAALQGYIAANSGDPLTSMDQLKPFLQEPLDDAILDRYEPSLGGNTNAPGYNPNDHIRLREKAAALIDTTYDPMFSVSPNGFGYRAGDGAIVPDAPNAPAGSFINKRQP